MAVAYLCWRQMTTDWTTTTTRRINTAAAATPTTDQADVHWVDTSDEMWEEIKFTTQISSKTQE